MGVEIQLQRWKEGDLWKSFKTKYPNTDSDCRPILFNITREFNALLDEFPKNENLKEVLQGILDDEYSCCKFYNIPATATSIKILYAVVNSYRLGRAATDNKKKASFENQPDNEECEIMYRLSWRCFQTPKDRNDLSKIGLFLENKIRYAIQLIDRVSATDTEDYFSTQETIRRTPIPNQEKENDPPNSDVPKKKFVKFNL